MQFIWVLLASMIGAAVWASFFEWALHKGLMHGRLLKSYPWRAHDQVHHVIFDSGRNYHLHDEKHRDLVTMAWWNAPVLMLANCPLPLAVGHFTGYWWAAAGAMAVFIAYYVVYEYFHWCMHVPGPRWFQQTRVFRLVDQRHRLHHLEPMRNLNVVLPVADWILGTRISRATVPATEV